jgi:hypothetical protein
VYGVSSGGMFALEAAAAGLVIDRLGVCEVPYDASDDAPVRYEAYRQQLADPAQSWSTCSDGDDHASRHGEKQ